MRVAAISWPEEKQGRPVQKSQPNIRAFLAASGVELRHNSFTRRIEITRDGRTCVLDDTNLRALRLEADAAGLSPKTDYFNDVIYYLAHQNSYHPVLAYLQGLEWDGTPRLSQMASKYLGASDTPLTEAMLPAFFVAAVKRIVTPGCKFDNLLVLEGPQGAGKSTFCKTLASEPWFSDSLSIGTDPKDTIESTSGKWICELAETAGLSKREAERVKASLSRSTDTATLKYQRLASDVPRQFVFIATSNNSQYLTDVTGNRRFWPVKVGQIDIEALSRDRDQIWAEAAHLEGEGFSTQIPNKLWEEMEKEQAERLVDDPWYDVLEPVLDGKTGAVAKKDIWKFLDIETHRQDPHVGSRITKVMTRLKFEPAKLRRQVGCGGEGKLTPCFRKRGWGDGPVPWINLGSRQ